MKTPEDIKRGLMCGHFAEVPDCTTCAYYSTDTEDGDHNFECYKIDDDALAYINLLEERIRGMQLQMMGDCGVCKHKDEQERCVTCMFHRDGGHPLWEYEGFPTDMEREE